MPGSLARNDFHLSPPTREPIASYSADAPDRRLRNVRIHEDREVGPEIATEYAVQREHRITAELSSATLVGFGRISQNDRRSPRGLHPSLDGSLCNVLCTRGKHQRHLGEGRQSGGLRIQQDVPNFSPVGVPPGSRVTVTAMPRDFSARQFLDLRAFPAAVKPFKCN